MRFLVAAPLSFFPIISNFNAFELLSQRGVSFRLGDALWLYGLIVLTFFVRLKIDKYAATAFISFLLFSFYAVTVSAVYDETTGLLKTIRLVQTLSWGIVAYYVFQLSFLYRNVLVSFVVAATALGILSIFVRLQNPNIHRFVALYGSAGGEGLGRQASFNEIAGFLTISIIVIVVCIANNKELLRIGKIKGYGYFLLGFIALLSTNSRSGLIAFLISFPFALLSSCSVHILSRFSPKRIAFTLALTSISMIVFSLYFSKFFRLNRYFDTFSEGTGSMLSIYQRLVIWADFLSVLPARASVFFLGKGKEWIPSILEVPTAENFFFDSIAAYGVVGFVPLIIFVYMPFFRAITGQNLLLWQKGLIIASTVAASLFSLTGNVLVDPMLGGSFFILIYGTLGYVSQKSTSSNRRIFL